MSTVADVLIIRPGVGFMPGAYYVMDRFGHTPQEARVSGPFATWGDAEGDRRALNIADDCDVCLVAE